MGLGTILKRRTVRNVVAAAAVVVLLGAACSSDDTTGDAVAVSSSASTETDAASAAGSDGATVVATTGMWADVVEQVACPGTIEVEVLIPNGGDPHSFEPSLQDRATIESASLVVSNGAGLEEGLLDLLETVHDAGSPQLLEIADHVSTIEWTDVGLDDEHGHGDEDDHGDEHSDEDGHDDEHSNDEHSDDEHSDEEHSDEDGHDDEHNDDDGHDDEHNDDDGHDDEHKDDHGHDDEAHDDEHSDDDGHDEDAHDDEHKDDDGHDEDAHDDEHDHAGGADPHLWFDPLRVSEALQPIAAALVAEVGLNAAAVEECRASFEADLAAADAAAVERAAALTDDQRKIVTNHDALGYFAARYDFDIIGTVIPAPSTLAATNPAGLEALADLIADAGVPAIFGDAGASTADADALADRIGGVAVVSLQTGSLGPDDDGYLDWFVSTSTAITDALGTAG